MIAVGIIVVWVVCGAFAYAITLAFFQREFPYTAMGHRLFDAVFSVCMGLLGPFGLLLTLCMYGSAKHGLMWRLPKCREESPR